MKHRIILTSNYSPWSPYSGGGQRSTHHIAEELSHQGYDVKVIYTSTFLESIKVPKSLSYDVIWAKFPGIKSSRKNIFRPLSAISVKKAVRKLITPNTIIHSNGEESALIGDLRADFSFKWVVTPRYPHIPKQASEIKPNFSNTLVNAKFSKYILLHKSLKEADAICPTSLSSLKEISNLFSLDEHNMHIIPNGIANEFLRSLPQKKTSLNRIIFFGRLSETKGVDVLLDACKLQSNLIDELVIIGRGKFESIIEQENLSGELAGKIKLMPWLSVQELAAEIRKSSLAVLPSREESFGNSIAEAMACEVPVITTNAGSIPEVIGGAENGIIVNIDDIDAVSENIKKILTNDDYRSKIAQNGRERILNNFSWQKTVDKYKEIYFS